MRTLKLTVACLMCVHSVDFDRQVIKLSFKAPRVKLTGWYEVRGRVLGLPFYGQGDYWMVFGKYGYCYHSDKHRRLNDLGILVRFASSGHMQKTHAHTSYTINTKHLHNTHAEVTQ